MKLQPHVEDECHKLISRHCKNMANEHGIRTRFTKATGVAAARRNNDEPLQWGAGRVFNPFYVRRRAEVVAKAIEDKIESGIYEPVPALIMNIPKPSGGGTRPISIFPVADSAVAATYYKQIMERNQSRISPFSYAYRKDLGIHDAIERLSRVVNSSGRLYLVEFDFSKYFDTISHDYVVETLERYFRVTKTELQVIRAVLRCQRAFGVERYRAGNFLRNKRGIPQGNCLSLFLANVACHELDLELARSGLSFARYADDIVLLCDTDRQAGQGLDLIIRHCSRAGLSVNFKKSDGITEFSPEAIRPNKADARSKTGFDFLGHRFSFTVVAKRDNPALVLVRRLSIRQRTVRGLKKKLSNIIYSHLLRYPMAGMFKQTRVKKDIDWDVVTCINDLRGYVYGGLPESEIATALQDRTMRLHQSRGIMAFFPLINDVVQLKRLDGWLVNALASAIRRRRKLLMAIAKAEGRKAKKYPLLDSAALLEGQWYANAKSRIPNDVTIPSLVRAWKYARAGLHAFNLQKFPIRHPDGDALY